MCTLKPYVVVFNHTGSWGIDVQCCLVKSRMLMGLQPEEALGIISFGTPPPQPVAHLAIRHGSLS